MNTKTKFGMLIASVALAASGAVCAADAPANPYVQAAGQTLMTNFGLCVRTGYWTPALAEAQGALGQNCQCDTDIIKCEAGAERVTLSARHTLRLQQSRSETRRHRQVDRTHKPYVRLDT